MKININKFELVLLASKRARNLNKTKNNNNKKDIFDKAAILALREIYLNI